MKKNAKVLCAGIMLAGILLSVSAVFVTKIGDFSDDIEYLLAARSISQGHYNNLYSPPYNKPIVFYPGYPFLLYIAHWAVGWHDNALRMLNVMLLWILIMGVYYLFKNLSGKTTDGIVMAAVCFLQPFLLF
jgi:4-amino-4-deoxy-L-arabinose transferase-like glycosyltransferase